MTVQGQSQDFYLKLTGEKVCSIYDLGGICKGTIGDERLQVNLLWKGSGCGVMVSRHLN